jgi:hypothetical protein
MKRIFTFFLLSTVFFSACTSPTPSTQAGSLRLQHTATTSPWLEEINDCASESTMTIQAELRIASSFDLTIADLAIQFGESDESFSGYQIGSDDILVIVNDQNPIGSLNPDQVLGLFTGRIRNWKGINGSDNPVQVWAFPSGEDVQQVFVKAALNGIPVTLAARLVMDPDGMLQAVAADVNAVGLVNRRWKAGNVSAVYAVKNIPVLILLPPDPHPDAVFLISCLQK